MLTSRNHGWNTRPEWRRSSPWIVLLLDISDLCGSFPWWNSRFRWCRPLTPWLDTGHRERSVHIQRELWHRTKKPNSCLRKWTADWDLLSSHDSTGSDIFLLLAREFELCRGTNRWTYLIETQQWSHQDADWSKLPGGSNPWCCCHFNAWPRRASRREAGTTLTSPASAVAIAWRRFSLFCPSAYA